MRKAAVYVNDYYKKNRLFEIDDNISNRDNCLYHWFVLKNYLKEADIELATDDINSIDESDIAIFSDMPDLHKVKLCKKNILILFESELIRPDNWDRSKHKYFDKILTWNDEWVDNKKYIKYCWPNKIPDKAEIQHIEKEKLCTLISGNKHKRHPNELYSERVRAIRWFEKNHIDKFDLYGIGWDKYTFSGKLTSHLNGITYLTRMFPSKYLSYKGSVSSKYDVLKKYKFAICYENAKNISGYITEKIFDCFFAGCVPIYLGAPNILDYIPEDTFINREKFSNYNELYNYITNMPDAEYYSYTSKIYNFLKSKRVVPFNAESFAEIVTNEVCEVLNL